MTCERAARVALTLPLASLLTFGCSPAPRPEPHYVLGAPYRVGLAWFYPREAYDLDETGLAAVAAGRHPPLTSDGEVFDQTALAAGHPTLQLPAIATLTNLETGLQVSVRVNDRGSGDPHRLLEITQRTATLLGMGDSTVARVRLHVLAVESTAAVEAMPDAPKLAMTAAPRTAVEVAELPPPGRKGASGVTVSGATATLARSNRIASGPMEIGTPAAPPLRLPEVVTRVPVRQTRLMVLLDSFGELRYAAVQQARMSAAGAHVVASRISHVNSFRVEIGPVASIAVADAVLDQALASGIPDARIVVN